MKSAVVIHRHFFTVSEVARLLLGVDADDCDAWEIRSEDGTIILDVIEPVVREKAESELVKVEQPEVANDTKPAKQAGGPLAQKAGILCGEKGFQTFLGVKTAEAAAEMIRHDCNVDSRAMLDRDEEAAKIFNDIAGKYALWLEGYD